MGPSRREAAEKKGVRRGGEKRKKKKRRKKKRKKARDGKSDKEEPMDGDRGRVKESEGTRKRAWKKEWKERERGGTTTNGRRGREFTRRGDAAQVLSGTKKWLFLLECARCTCTFSRRTDGPRVVA